MGSHEPSAMIEDRAIYAPAGWGFVPGRRLDRPTAADIPELPMLRFLSGRERNDAIVSALQEWPDLPHAIRPVDIANRYGLAKVSAYEILQRARR